jgi:hypothetical protein
MGLQDGKQQDNGMEDLGEFMNDMGVDDGKNSQALRWRTFAPNAACKPVNVGILEVSNQCYETFMRMDIDIVGTGNNMHALLAVLNNTDHSKPFPEIKDPHHVAPLQATEGTADAHEQARETHKAKAVKIIGRILALHRRLMPAIVRAGQANYRARTNIKRYKATANAEEERRRGYVADVQERRNKAKAKLSAKLNALGV